MYCRRKVVSPSSEKPQHLTQRSSVFSDDQRYHSATNRIRFDHFRNGYRESGAIQVRQCISVPLVNSPIYLQLVQYGIPNAVRPGFSCLPLRKVSAYPPVISISVRNLPEQGNAHKDTSRNILTTKQFTVNIISEAWVSNANVCAIDAPPDVSEWPISGLTKAPSVGIGTSPEQLYRHLFSTDFCPDPRQTCTREGKCLLNGVRGLFFTSPRDWRVEGSTHWIM